VNYGQKSFITLVPGDEKYECVDEDEPEPVVRSRRAFDDENEEILGHGNGQQKEGVVDDLGTQYHKTFFLRH
jgi:hypothetical protein